jgi:hypothetical protein
LNWWIILCNDVNKQNKRLVNNSFFRYCQSTIREINRKSPRPLEITFCQNVLAI